ncbi:MAG TPA: hypothetical protein VHB21_10985 [Minicystis sp.]|nr:hypothetical protein [Minicystis sp.]
MNEIGNSNSVDGTVGHWNGAAFLNATNVAWDGGADMGLYQGTAAFQPCIAGDCQPPPFEIPRIPAVGVWGEVESSDAQVWGRSFDP